MKKKKVSIFVGNSKEEKKATRSLISLPGHRILGKRTPLSSFDSQPSTAVRVENGWKNYQICHGIVAFFTIQHINLLIKINFGIPNLGLAFRVTQFPLEIDSWRLKIFDVGFAPAQWAYA